MREAGIPAGVVNVLPGTAEAGEALVRHPLVQKISFTGGPTAARAILATCAETLKPAVLELGGKSASLVFPDADLDAVAFIATASVHQTLAGQGCALATRLVVHESVYDELAEKVVAFTRDITLGDPFDPTTGMGPVVNRAAQERILAMVERARADGTAKLLAGGGAPGGDLADGFYVEPTVFGDVDPRSELGQVEVFGPVLVAHAVRDRGGGAGRSPTAPPTAWPPTSGPTTSAGSTGWCPVSKPAACTSTARRRSPAASCPSAASASPASAGRAASKACSSSSARRRWRSHDRALGPRRRRRGHDRRRQRHRSGHRHLPRRARLPVVASDLDADRADETAATRHATAGGEAVGLRGRRLGPGRTSRPLRDLCLDRFGRLDVVMNNVGVLTMGAAESLPLEAWQRILDLNLLSIARSNLVFLPHLIEQGRGHVVNTSSASGLLRLRVRPPARTSPPSTPSSG